MLGVAKYRYVGYSIADCSSGIERLITSAWRAALLHYTVVSSHVCYHTVPWAPATSFRPHLGTVTQSTVNYKHRLLPVLQTQTLQLKEAYLRLRVYVQVSVSNIHIETFVWQLSLTSNSIVYKMSTARWPSLQISTPCHAVSIGSGLGSSILLFYCLFFRCNIIISNEMVYALFI